ncbi:MAG: NAD(P)/FAD-dependent oxidoreductase, partial [archaeon]
QAGFEPYKPQNLLKTIQADCRMPSERDKVALYFSREYTDGFFAWTIPAGDFVRVGVGSFSDAPQKFDAFLKKLGAKPESKFAGVIPIKGALKRTQSSNAYLVGDAAGQVKPTTGGGVITGMKSAKILADCLKNGVSYETRWRAELEKDLQMGLMIREFASKLSDAQLDLLFDVAVQEDVPKLLEQYGNMDKPTTLLKSEKIIRLISRISGLYSGTPTTFSVGKKSSTKRK